MSEMRQYAIIDASKIGEANPYTERPLTDPKDWELRDLEAKCARYNSGLALKGSRVSILRDAAAHLLDQEQFDAVRSWEKGRWTGDTPDKDKRYVVVSRTVTRWAEEA